MENVETVELVLENGESYEFKSSECSVVLEQVTENISNLGGRLFKTRVANKAKIALNTDVLGEWKTFRNIGLEMNILEIALSNHLGHVEKYYVKWGEDDIDMNSLQQYSESDSGELRIKINSN